MKGCASGNTGSLFELGEGRGPGEVAFTTPGVSGRMGRVPGPSRQGKFF